MTQVIEIQNMMRANSARQSFLKARKNW